jgi:Rrf2 family protein
MLVTQKTQYALRAIFELAKHQEKGLRKISDIARAQAIPERFLEVILSQLKRSGFVTSKRGYHGGYRLITPPEEISVGDILRFMEQSQDPLHCIACISRCKCPLNGGCAFKPMWNQIEEAIYHIYDQTTIQDLINNESGCAAVVNG